MYVRKMGFLLSHRVIYVSCVELNKNNLVNLHVISQFDLILYWDCISEFKYFIFILNILN